MKAVDIMGADENTAIENIVWLIEKNMELRAIEEPKLDINVSYYNNRPNMNLHCTVMYDCSNTQQINTEIIFYDFDNNKKILFGDKEDNFSFLIENTSFITDINTKKSFEDIYNSYNNKNKKLIK